jgi:hypothetical protein
MHPGVPQSHHAPPASVCPPKAGKDKQSMSKRTGNSLFIDPSMPRFYQQLLSGVADYKALGNRIIKRIEAAHAFRQVEQVRELSRVLINIPIKEYQLIAQYYLVWCKCREYEYPLTTLERIIEQTKTYKVKALFSRAAFEGFNGGIANAIGFYLEALKTSPTISEYVDLVRSIAVLKATEGFHKSALRDLENLVPLIKHVEPRLYYDYLNSYAIELGEAGYKQEARNIIKHVLESPFAFAYPEWYETAEELKGANRSFAVIDPSPANAAQIYSMPLAEKREASRQDKPASITDLQEWKKKMGKEPNGEENDKPKTTSERLVKLLSMVNSELNDTDLDRVIDLLEKLHSKKKP